MTEIIKFPLKRAKRKRASRPTGGAEIIIFTGVRFERRDFEPEMSSKTKRRRRSRPQTARVMDA